MASVSQLNVRLDKGLKERGDATLRLAGSTPVKIIRQLWEHLALGGDAYERIMKVLSPAQDVDVEEDAHLAIMRSANLFQEFGTLLDEDLSMFHADLRPTSEILEEIECERLEQRELA